MKAESLAELPDAIMSACLKACRNDPASVREVLRHLAAQMEHPLSPGAAKLMASLMDKLEASLDGQ